jgi:capsular polysaccharide transport system permease protein
MMTEAAFASALKTQGNVIGALIMRELHTRFGRENIGYLWIFAEPMLLAAAVALLHAGQHLPLSGNIRPVPFAISGYALFILFRSTVSRAETLLEANRPLLHHRQVTILDMLVARALLEMASIATVLTILLTGSWFLGLADPPADFLAVAAALILIGWFSFAMSLLICALSHESPLIGRLVHPLLYLMMPLSGAFFAMLWLPAEWREMAQWIPLVPMFELLKVGMFAGYPADYVDLVYAMSLCATLTIVGLVLLRLIRSRVQVV